MGIFDATKLRPFASQYPGRNQNFIQTLDYNSDTGMYEINFSPHTGYNTYAQAPTWQMGGAASPHGSGCPEGQVMGADGICRIDPNYTGQPTFDTQNGDQDDDQDQDQDDGGGGGGGTSDAFDTGTDDAYQRQEDLYKRVQAGAVGEASPGELANLRMDKYQTLPGGMKNWSESQLFQYALDRNFFTGDERLGISWKDYADQIPKPGEHRYADYNSKLQSYFDSTMIGMIGQHYSDKAFDDWVELATKKGIIEYDAKTKKYKILKGPGGNENALYAGGYLVPLDEYKQVEADYQQGYFTPVEAPDQGVADIDVKTISNIYDDLNKQNELWWMDTFNNWIDGVYRVGDYENLGPLQEGQQIWPSGLLELAQDDHIMGPDAFGMYPGARDMGDDRYEIGGEFYNAFKNHILDEAKLYDKDRSREYTIPGTEGTSQKQHFDMAHPEYDTITDQLMSLGLSQVEADKQYWLSSAGIPKENFGDYRLTSKGPHVEEPGIYRGEGTIVPALAPDLSKPMMTKDLSYKQVNAIYGENSTEVTIVHGSIFNTQQKTDRVNAGDGSNGTTDGWGYNADGRFVNVNTGQTAAMGSMADGIEAIKNGTASSKLLDRFHWGDGSSTGYKSKEEYMAAKDAQGNDKNKVMYRNNDGEQTVVNSGSYDAKDDNSKGKIICDYFYRKGLLSEKLWKADEAYGEELSRTEPDVMKGYHAWARHYVREMEKESLLGKVYFAWAKLWVPHWAKYLAGEKTIRGKILHSIGKPICNIIGKFNRRIKWQEA